MNYLYFVDVQSDSIIGPSATPAAQSLARRIIDCAYQVKDCPDLFTRATSRNDEGGELFSCLGSLVKSRTRRTSQFAFSGICSLVMSQPGHEPDSVYMCGFDTSGSILPLAILIRSNYPKAKVTILEDLCHDQSYDDHLAALRVARSCGIAVSTAQVALGITIKPTAEGVEDSSDAR